MEILEELGLRRAMQISLLNCITPNLRQVNVIKSDKSIILNFYYDHMVEGEEELPNEVETEMWGFYYGSSEILTNIIISQFPNPIPQEGLCVYCRAGESDQPFINLTKPLKDAINIHLLVSRATQIALLGHVTPNLRKILSEENDSQLILRFYYDKIAENDKNWPPLISDMVKSFFNKKEIIIFVSVLPFPTQIPSGSAIYARYENFEV